MFIYHPWRFWVGLWVCLNVSTQGKKNRPGASDAQAFILRKFYFVHLTGYNETKKNFTVKTFSFVVFTVICHLPKSNTEYYLVTVFQRLDLNEQANHEGLRLVLRRDVSLSRTVTRCP